MANGEEKTLRILILEDSVYDAELMQRELKKGQVSFVSRCAGTKDAFVRDMTEFKPEIILADYNLPSFNGYSALEIAKRECPDVPFIFVSGAIGEEFAIESLKNGATDYVLKDRMARLVPSVRRAIREKAEETKRQMAEEDYQKSCISLRKMMSGTIQAIARMIEMRDPYTAGHEKRVAKLSSLIAERLGVSKDLIDGVAISGLLHDVGKIAVPVEILSKPGKLTESEFSLIHTHPVVGYRILKDIEFPWPVAQTVLQHHERFDGSGYPSGLAGENIILEARILGVADSIEAMASYRPYRPAMGIMKALEEIAAKRGILYDPNVADICLTLFKEEGFGLD